MKNGLENLAEIIDHYFGNGAASFSTNSGIENNITLALNEADFKGFRDAFCARMSRLSLLYPASDANRKFLLDRLGEIASTGKWEGVYAEMVALDFLNSETDWRRTAIQLSKSFPASETLAGGLGGNETNCDGYYEDFNVSFDVKILGDKSKKILDGLITQVTKSLGVSDSVLVIPEYPPDMSYEIFENCRNALRLELEKELRVGKGLVSVKSAVVADLNYRMTWVPGIVATTGVYSPYRHASEHHTLLFKHAKKFSRTMPCFISFVHFPWFSESVVSQFSGSHAFYRSFCRRFFCQYMRDSRPASDMLGPFKGSETVSQVTDKLSGVLFLEDTSLIPMPPDDLHVKGYAFLNPNAVNKLDGNFRDHLVSLGVQVDDFRDDNY